MPDGIDIRYANLMIELQIACRDYRDETTMEYQGVWQMHIDQCPKSKWSIRQWHSIVTPDGVEKRYVNLMMELQIACQCESSAK
ncbi:hypothetical protein CEXT_451511 [Caerostris extrusa]|uniref:Uncharacterized protein n=1 Tax=Caerostris extrusa TaxID=172846 RepID=A0AAV4VFR1_CAEEX|nr:hypothetical protein CEXT_451511 [Caerostris extrusa]